VVMNEPCWSRASLTVSSFLGRKFREKVSTSEQEYT